MTSNLELVEGAYDSFAEGDIDGFLAPFSDDFTWIEAEGGRTGAPITAPTNYWRA